MKKIGIELNERFQPLIAPPLGDPGGSEQHGGRDANRLTIPCSTYPFEKLSLWASYLSAENISSSYLLGLLRG